MQSRFNILAEGYVKTVNIEGQMTAFMAKTMILPAALRYQQEVGESVAAAKAAGAATSPAGIEMLSTVVSTISDFGRAIGGLERRGHHGDGDLFGHAKHTRDGVLAAMLEVRKVGDKLETIVADDLWPIPTYREMLFIK